MGGKGWPAPGCLAVGLALRANQGVRRRANSVGGKALPCTPAEEGAAKPRPYQRELSSHSVICTPYSELCFTFALLHRPPADLHFCTVSWTALLSLPLPNPPNQLAEPTSGLGS
jgi:hypothetical protein